MTEKFTGLPDLPPGGPDRVDLSSRLGGGRRAGHVLLVGCGTLLALLGVAAIVFLLQADDVVGWVFDSLEEAVVERLPPDLPGAERERLERAFAAARARIEAGEADPEALRLLQRRLAATARGGEGPLDREELTALRAALEEVAGTAEEATPPGETPRVLTGPGAGDDSDLP